MLPGRLKIQLIAFFLLSGGVAANLFLLQKGGRGPFGEPVLISQNHLAGHPGAGRGVTGSLGAVSAGASSTKIQARFTNGATHRDDNGGVGAEGLNNPVELTRAIQRELNGRGYQSGVADGLVGPLTRAAIMAFEYDHGLGLTGQPTSGLLKQILLGRAAVSPSRGEYVRVQSAEAKAIIRSVQDLLAKLGYKPGPINGRLDPRTSRAIRKFEMDQALPESGRISGPLISRLVHIAAKRRVASGR